MKKKKKIKLKKGRILIFLFCAFLFVLILVILFNIKIKNIIISGNNYLKDQDIIDSTSIKTYPKSLINTSSKIKKELENNNLILKADVKKIGLSKVYIEIIENRPLFYYLESGKTVYENGYLSDIKYPIPTLLNHITDSYYNDFIKEMSKLDESVINRISEIKFSPNEVDDNRFLLLMKDGNYVYINISTFYKLNKYLTIIESLPNEKGILYLDYGNNFEIISQ